VYALFLRLLAVPPLGPLASLNATLRRYTDSQAAVFEPLLGYQCTACRGEFRALAGQGLNPAFPFVSAIRSEAGTLPSGTDITASHDDEIEEGTVESLLELQLIELSST
jgi:hypothetical protein